MFQTLGSRGVLGIGVIGVVLGLVYSGVGQSEPASGEASNAARGRDNGPRPKHTFEFTIRYEGDGLIDASIVELIRAKIEAESGSKETEVKADTPNKSLPWTRERIEEKPAQRSRPKDKPRVEKPTVDKPVGEKPSYSKKPSSEKPRPKKTLPSTEPPLATPTPMGLPPLPTIPVSSEKPR